MCERHLKRREEIRDKVLANVHFEDGPLDTPCWVWQAGTSGAGRGGGYARMNLNGGTVAVHRTMWINEYGIIPPKKQIDHKCRNRLCCNPGHLEMLTHKQNQKRRDEANVGS